MIEENLALIDAVIYILDARAPKSCLNPTLDALVKNKPIIYVLNKADLIEKDDLRRAEKYFAAAGFNIVPLNSTVSKSSSAIFGLVKQLCEEKLARAQNRGIKRALRAMVIGIPNGGKSTFINNLSGAGKANTGNKAGVTRGKQWVSVNEYFEVLDTPGTLYPRLDNQKVARNLAYIGSINDDILDKFELARHLVVDLDKINPSIISDRYKIEPSAVELSSNELSSKESSSNEFSPKVGELDLVNARLEGVAKSRGFVGKGGALDLEKAAVALIDDFRKGKLGKIILEQF